MMINKRLIHLVKESKKYIAQNVFCQWCATLLEGLWLGKAEGKMLLLTVLVAAAALLIQYGMTLFASRMSFLSSKAVKKTLREKIYRKLTRLGASDNQQVATSAVIQMAVEGVDQLETYFGAYLPQFFYALLAPLTLFCVLAPVSLSVALVLLICVREMSG